MADKLRLTPELTGQIASAIRAGGYPHVAAEAYGVPKDVFDDWLKRGNTTNAWEPYRSFAFEIRQAFAQARLRAEMAGYEKDPKAWLIHGPGRESEQRPGWSVSVHAVEATPESHNALLDPDIIKLFRTVLKVLEPFPEVRSHVAQALLDSGVKVAA